MIDGSARDLWLTKSVEINVILLGLCFETLQHSLTMLHGRTVLFRSGNLVRFCADPPCLTTDGKDTKPSCRERERESCSNAHLLVNQLIHVFVSVLPLNWKCVLSLATLVVFACFGCVDFVWQCSASVWGDSAGSCVLAGVPSCWYGGAWSLFSFTDGSCMLIAAEFRENVFGQAPPFPCFRFVV